jgi:hypothetical protein
VFLPSAPHRSCADGRNTPGHDGEETAPLNPENALVKKRQ